MDDIPGLDLRCGDAAAVLAGLPDESVHCCCTSPPYYGLRAYLPSTHDARALEIGHEATPAAYVARLLAVFRAVWRVLRADGTLFVVLGDSYGREREKSLCGIPWRVAFALMDAGWILRNDAIWHKASAMPSSVRDRWTLAHEYVFFFTKQARYAFDLGAILEPATYGGDVQTLGAKSFSRGQAAGLGLAPWGNGLASTYTNSEWRHPRDVFRVPYEPTSEAHYAPFPAALIRPLLAAGCPERLCATCGRAWQRRGTRPLGALPASHGGSSFARGKTGVNGLGRVQQEPSTTSGPGHLVPGCACAGGTVPGVVLDPFLGSGTTAAAALAMGRHALGIELSADYLALARRRCARAYYEGMHGLEHHAAQSVEGQLAFAYDAEESG
jgi:DNA modification methylase